VYSGSELDGALLAIARVLDLDEEWLEDLGRAIEGWNDDPNRTFAEVRQVIEKADI
jgi:uncharacterized small protein (DUF1192 family)